MMSRIQSSSDTTITMQSTAGAPPVFEKSIFQSHMLHPTGFQISPLRMVQPDWILGVLLLCFILLAWGQVFYHRRIMQIFRAPFSKRFINQLKRDGNLFKERISIVLGIVYILSLSMFLYETNELTLGYYFQGFAGLLLYGLIIVIIVVFMAAKVALVQWLGVIFKTRETTRNYLLNMLIFFLISGPVLLIALVFIIYLKSFVLIYICTSVFFVILLFRFMRGFFIGISLRKFSYLFLFVYLCGLEILPLLVLIKILLIYTQHAGV